MYAMCVRVLLSVVGYRYDYVRLGVYVIERCVFVGVTNKYYVGALVWLCMGILKENIGVINLFTTVLVIEISIT